MEQRLSTAFQEILSGLEKGQRLETLLAAYPDLADELRPLLQTALLVPQARANRQEVQAMRTRLDRQFASQVSALEVPKGRSRRPLWALVASISLLLLGFWFLFPRGSSENASELELTQGTLAATASATVSPSPTASETVSPSPSPSATATETASPSATASETVSPSPSTTASKTSLPLATHTSPAVTPVCSPRTDWPVYRLESGDTLSEIALNAEISLAELMAANCLDNPRSLLVGQRIYVPMLWEDENGSEDDASEEDDDLPDPTDEADDDSVDDNSGSSDDSGLDDDNSGSDDDSSGSEDDAPDPTDEPDD